MCSDSLPEKFDCRKSLIKSWIHLHLMSKLIMVIYHTEEIPTTFHNPNLHTHHLSIIITTIHLPPPSFHYSPPPPPTYYHEQAYVTQHFQPQRYPTYGLPPHYPQIHSDEPKHQNSKNFTSYDPATRSTRVCTGVEAL